MTPHASLTHATRDWQDCHVMLGCGSPFINKPQTCFLKTQFTKCHAGRNGAPNEYGF